MTKQEQTKSERSMPKDKSDHMNPSVQPRDLTRKQLKLARLIADEFVAKFEAVVEAIKNRRYKQVDAWKAEAGIRAATPPRLDPRFAECLARQNARLEGRR
jgi:hypothetical protein